MFRSKSAAAISMDRNSNDRCGSGCFLVTGAYRLASEEYPRDGWTASRCILFDLACIVVYGSFDIAVYAVIQAVFRSVALADWNELFQRTGSRETLQDMGAAVGEFHKRFLV